jgi:hypothetical protein
VREYALADLFYSVLSELRSLFLNINMGFKNTVFQKKNVV